MDAKARKKIQDRIITLIGKCQELEGICMEHNVNLYPEIHLSSLEQEFMAAYSKIEDKRDLRE